MKVAIIFIAAFCGAADAVKCFVCTGERDHIGFKDEKNQDCWENPENSSYLIARNCGIGEDYCVTSVMVDFRFDGMLISTMTRKCATAGSIGSLECKESEDSDEIGFEFKDCKTVCQEDGCNDSRTNQEVLSEYSTGTVKSCRTCSETKIGAYNDLECENEETIDCPAYADTSCFTAAYTREFDGTYSHQLNKGCSSFKSNFEDDPTCFEINHGDDGFYREETCKESCSEDNCNNVITQRPCLDNQICPEIETTTEHQTTEVLTTPSAETTTEQVLSTTESVPTTETTILTTASRETSTQTSTTTLSTSKPTTTAETTISTTSTSTITTTMSTTTAISTIPTSTESSSTSTSASTTTASLITSTTSSSTSSPPTSSISSLSTSTTTSQSTKKEDSDGGCDHTCIIIISTVVPTTCVIVGLCVYLFIFRDRKDVYEEEFSESPRRKTCSTEVKDTQF